MKTVPTFIATIYVGLKDRDDRFHPKDEALQVIQDYVDQVGLCVTVTNTEFIYTNGNEPGLTIGFINYPRFPADNYIIAGHATHLAELLKEKLKQRRVSVVFPTETIMLE